MNFEDCKEQIIYDFSTRQGGVSTGVYESMNLSLTLPDDPANVRRNYEIWCERLGVDVRRIVIGHQTHTSNVVRVDERHCGQGLDRKRMEDVDGLVTNVPGVALVTHHADCVPVYLFDPVNRAIGMIHAGWRGTVQEIARIAVESMTREFGSQPTDMIARIGPCICQEHFECDRDVVDAANAMSIDVSDQICYDSAKNKFHVSVSGINRKLLLSTGIPTDRIDMQDRCTYGNPELYFSHRRDGRQRGGHAALLMLRN